MMADIIVQRCGPLHQVLLISARVQQFLDLQGADAEKRAEAPERPGPLGGASGDLTGA